MAATNRERQAAFKRNMRDAGMRQVTIWLDPSQEQEVKALLSGSRQDEAETHGWPTGQKSLPRNSINSVRAGTSWTHWLQKPVCSKTT